MPKRSLADIRREYLSHGLHERDAGADPMALFATWMSEAVSADTIDPTAMVLSTVSTDGKPSSRVVLLKGVDERGFVFYTNYESEKGRQMAGNPHVSLLFYWHELHRQVRVNGTVTLASVEESAAYFKTRPFESQIAAWASAQSRAITDRDELDERFAELKAEYDEREVPLPPFWGGYAVTPESIEFWAGRPNRLHDRLLYVRQGTVWSRMRLAP